MKNTFKKLTLGLLMMLCVGVVSFGTASCDLLKSCSDNPSTSSSSLEGPDDSSSSSEEPGAPEEPTCEHTHSDWVTVRAATCTEAGSKNKVCLDCEEVLEANVTIVATGHTLESKAAKEATCTSIGWNAYEKCTVCDYSTYEEIDATGHDYTSSVTTEATCTEKGVATYTCQNGCGNSYVEEIAATGHKHTLSGTTEATCTGKGVKTFTCENGCGDSYTTDIVALGHDWGDHVRTCTEGRACTRTGCDEFEPALGHNLITTTVVEPTCMAVGASKTSCGRAGCGYSITSEIPATGHIFATVARSGEADDVQEKPVSEGSCEYIRYKVCLSCEQEIEVEEHIFKHEYVASVATAATCTTEGVKTFTCIKCTNSDNEEIDAKLKVIPVDTVGGHNWEEQSNADGVITYVCAHNRQHTKQVVTAGANGAVSGSALAAAGEVALENANIALDGDTKTQLSGKNLTISVNTLEGDDIDDAKAGLSEEEKALLGNSPIYNFLMKEDETAISQFDGTLTVTLPYELAEGEDVDSIVIWYINDQGVVEPKEATYSEVNGKGYVSFETTHFSYYTVSKMTPAERCEKFGHSNTTRNVPATCTTEGYTLTVCARCGLTSKTNVVAALGHDYKVEGTPATCTEGGTVVKTCKREGCENSYRDTQPALGHTWVKGEAQAATCAAAGYEVYTCDNDGCNETYRKTLAALAHQYTVTKIAATCGQGGYTQYACKNCDYSYKTNYTEALAHAYKVEWTWTLPDGGDASATAKISCSNAGCTLTPATLSATVVSRYVESTSCLRPTEIVHTASATYQGIVYSASESQIISAIDHNYSKRWERDDSFHWHICNACGSVGEKAAHSYAHGVCTVCGAEETIVYEYLNLVSSLVKEPTAHVTVEGFSLQVQQTEGIYDKNGVLISDSAQTFAMEMTGDMELYLTLTDDNQLYGEGFYSFWVSAYDEEEFMESEILLKDGYLYIVVKDFSLVEEEGTYAFNVQAFVEQALGSTYTQLVEMKEQAEAMAAIAESILASDEYEQLATMLEEVVEAYQAGPGATANATLKKVVDIFFDVTEENGNTVYTLDVKGMQAFNADAYGLTIAELLDKYLGENTYKNLIKVLGDLGNVTVESALETFASYGFEAKTVCAFIDYAAATFGNEGLNSIGYVEQMKDMSVSTFLYMMQSMGGDAERDEYYENENGGFNDENGGFSGGNVGGGAYEEIRPVGGERSVAMEEDEEEAVDPATWYAGIIAQLDRMATVATIYDLVGKSDYQSVNDMLALLEGVPVAITVNAEGKLVSDFSLRKTVNDAIGAVVEFFFDKTEIEGGYRYELKTDAPLNLLDNLYNKTIEENLVDYLGEENAALAPEWIEALMTQPLGEVFPTLQEILYSQGMGYYGEATLLQLVYPEMSQEQAAKLAAMIINSLDSKLFDVLAQYTDEEGVDAAYIYQTVRSEFAALASMRFAFETLTTGHLVSATYDLSDFAFDLVEIRYGEESKSGNYISTNIAITANGTWSFDREESDFDFNEKQILSVQVAPTDPLVETLGLTLDEKGNILSVELEMDDEWEVYDSYGKGAYGWSYEIDEVNGSITYRYRSGDMWKIAGGEYEVVGYRLTKDCGDWYRLNLLVRSAKGNEVYSGTFCFDGYGNLVEDRSDYELVGTEKGEIISLELYYNAKTKALAEESQHELTNGKVEGNCAVPGYTYEKCSNCDYEYRDYDWQFNEHDYVVEYELFGGSCTDGVQITKTCQVCGETEIEFTDWHETESKRIDLKEITGCGGFLYVYACACGERNNSDYGLGCSRRELGEDSQGYTIFRCDNCGATLAVKRTVSEKNAWCEMTVDIEYVLTGSGGKSVSWETREWNFDHDEQYAYALVEGGLTCEDGWTYTVTCADCGYEYSYTEYGCKTVKETKIPLEGVCEGTELSTSSCVCGREFYLDITEKCEFQRTDDTVTDVDGSYMHTYADECKRCGLRIQTTEKEVKDEACNVTSYYEVIITVNNVPACETITHTSHDVRHTYVATQAEFLTESHNCEDGVLITFECVNCGHSYNEKNYWHIEYAKERYLLTDYGATCCSGSVVVYGCACDGSGKLHVEWEGDCCEFEKRRLDEVWIEGIVETYTYVRFESGYINDYQYSLGNYAEQWVCFVTEPACGFTIRYASYWLPVEGACVAEQWIVYQLGYNSTTDSYAKQIVLRTGNYTTCHRAVQSDDTENGWRISCSACGSYYESTATGTSASQTESSKTEYSYLEWSYVDGEYQSVRYSGFTEYTYTRDSEGREIGRTEEERSSYGESVNYYYRRYSYIWYKGYQYQTEVYETTTENQDSWNRYVYEYNFEADCVRTVTHTTSEGYEYTYTENCHKRSSRQYETPTCTESGSEWWYCLVCNKELERNTLAPTHSYDHRVTVKEATCTQFGEAEYRCVACEEVIRREPITPNHVWSQLEEALWVCSRCGLQNANGASGDIVMEDLSDDEYYIVGYYARNGVEFLQSVSLILHNPPEGVDPEQFLQGITVEPVEGIVAYRFSKEEVAAVALERGYEEGSYDVRFAFVPEYGDHSHDYAITFTGEYKNVTEIVEAGTYVCDITEETEYVYTYTITVTESAKYTFMGGRGAYVDVQLRNAAEEALNWDYSDSEYNFVMSSYLEAGQTYTLSLMFNDGGTGEVKMFVYVLA